MRSALILGLIAFLVAAGYGIHRNPRACEKLGLDLFSDTLAIYTTPMESGSASATPLPDVARASGTTTATSAAARALSPESTPAVAPQLPVVAPVAPTPAVVAPAPAAVVPASTQTAPQPQYSVGYVAALPSAPTPVPQPAPLPAAAPRSATYPAFADYSSGLEAARKYHVPMLVLFTGSDWCQYAQMLDREVLSTNDFTKFSSSHFVFVTIDDLRNTPVMDDQKMRITALEEKFSITGFPTLVVVDENEKEKGRAEGYNPGSGPSAVVQELSPLANR